MSARTNFGGLDRRYGQFLPDLVPNKIEQMPIYLSKQFELLSLIINGIVAGGAFTPHAVIPEKLQDSDIYYFPFAIAETGITSGGLWQWNLTRYDDNLEIVEPRVPVWQQLIAITKPVIARP